MSLHIVHFMRSINPDTLNGLQNVSLSALKEGATEIQINMSSDGGNNDQGFAAYHFLLSLPATITTHCIGNVESMAIIMYLAGKKRSIVTHGKIKIHPMHWNFARGPVDHDRLVEYVDSLYFDSNRFAEIFDERTNKAEGIFDVRTHLAGKAKILSSNDAITSGIATEVSDAQIPANSIRWWV